MNEEKDEPYTAEMAGEDAKAILRRVDISRDMTMKIFNAVKTPDGEEFGRGKAALHGAWMHLTSALDCLASATGYLSIGDVPQGEPQCSHAMSRPTPFHD